MHIHKLADLAVFDEAGVGGRLPATAEYREFMKKLHPAQLLSPLAGNKIFICDTLGKLQDCEKVPDSALHS